METFRSEYSEDGALSSARFGGSSTGSSASLSFASQTGSFDSQSARSGFLGAYEHKFHARKAEKERTKRKKEREAAAHSNQTSSAEEKWRADREADRAVRKREMATWLPTAAALKRVERERAMRSRERMQRVLSWYPTLSSSSSGAEGDVVHPLFALASGTASGTASSSMTALTEQQRAAEDDARRRAANDLQRQMRDLTLKVSFVEQQQQQQRCSSSEALRPYRETPPRSVRKRRLGREQLAPLRDGGDLSSDADPAPTTTPWPTLARAASHSALGTLDAHQAAARAGAGPLQRTSATAQPSNSSRQSLQSRRMMSSAMSMSQLAAVGEDEDAEDAAEMAQFLLLHRRHVSPDVRTCALAACVIALI